MAVCAYSVDTSSKFSFFIEDENILEADPDEIFEKVKKESELQKAAKKSDSKKGKQKPVAPPVQPAAAAPPKEIKVQQSLQAIKPLKAVKKPEVNEPQVVPTSVPVESVQQLITESRSDNSYRGRGQRGRGLVFQRRDDYPVQQDQVTGSEIRRGNSGGVFRGNYRGRGRTFERHSGSAVTGVKAVDKRGGSGRNNWGNPVDDGQEVARQEISDSQLEVVLDAEIHADVDKDAVTETVGNENIEESNEDNVNKEIHQLTLEEYFATRSNRLEEIQQKLSHKKKCVLPVPKSGEFAGMTPYRKEFAMHESSEEEDERIEIESKHKQLVDVNLRFGPPRGGRGARGGGQLRGGRGVGFRGRGGRISGEVLNVDNVEEFPALS